MVTQLAFFWVLLYAPLVGAAWIAWRATRGPWLPLLALAPLIGPALLIVLVLPLSLALGSTGMSTVLRATFIIGPALIVAVATYGAVHQWHTLQSPRGGLR